MPRKKSTATTSVEETHLRPERYEKVYRSRKSLMLNNFLGGVMWGLGSVIGATVVVALLGFVIVQTRRLPFLGDLVEIGMESILEAEPLQELNGQK